MLRLQRDFNMQMMNEMKHSELNTFVSSFNGQLFYQVLHLWILCFKFMIAQYKENIKQRDIYGHVNDMVNDIVVMVRKLRDNSYLSDRMIKCEDNFAFHKI